MALLKNTATHPVCLSTGRMLAVGEAGEGDATADADLIALGLLTPMQNPVKSTRTKVEES